MADKQPVGMKTHSASASPDPGPKMPLNPEVPGERRCGPCGYALAGLDPSGHCLECGARYAFLPWKGVERFGMSRWGWVISIGIVVLMWPMIFVLELPKEGDFDHAFMLWIVSTATLLILLTQLYFTGSWIEFDWEHRTVRFRKLLRLSDWLFWRRHRDITMPMFELVSGQQIVLFPGRGGSPIVEMVRIITTVGVAWLPPLMNRWDDIDDMVHWITHGETMTENRTRRGQERAAKRRRHPILYTLFILSAIAACVAIIWLMLSLANY